MFAFVSCVHRRIVKDSAGCVVHVDVTGEWGVPAAMGLETWLVEQGVVAMLSAADGVKVA